MPIPQYGLVSAGAPAGHGIPESPLSGLTELRVHGVGGEPPEALLNDLAPVQVSGDGIAGFYRTTDYHPSAEDSRHVEGYSWGGLTSKSSSRILWLLLLPFMFGNLAGWMCSADLRKPGRPGWRFRLHRASASLACLGLTVNFFLVITMITADVVAYQATRAGDTKDRWWLAPLRWGPILTHPARQLVLGVVVPLVVVIFIWALSELTRSRYEATRPPFKGKPSPERSTTVAATLEGGLSHEDFWDGEHSVKHAARQHVAAAIAFLALALAITSKQAVIAANGAVRAGAWWWIAVVGGVAVIALVGARSCFDSPYSKDQDRRRRVRSLDRGASAALLVIAAAAIVCAGIFASLQPRFAAQAGQLPGIAGIFRWTMTGIAITIGLVLLASIAGGVKRGTLPFAPFVITVLAFSLLNAVLLGALLSAAHLMGNLTFAASAGSAQIYVPDLIGFGAPALVIAGVVAVLLFVLAEAISVGRALGSKRDTIRQYYDNQYSERIAEELREKPESADADPRLWEASAVRPLPGDDKNGGVKWVRGIARAQRIGEATRDAGWLLWAIAVFNIAVVVIAITLHPAIDPHRVLGKAAIAIGTALPLFLIGVLRNGWKQQGKRKSVGIIWDVGTFWPRSYHPLAPPCYAERAVPDLQRRLWWLKDNGGRVVLAAHSQGTVIAAAALLQAQCLPDNDQTNLVTFGSPLRKLYAWAFPGYVNDDRLKTLCDGRRTWRNIYYPTDPIGSHIFKGPSAGGQPDGVHPGASVSPECQTVDLELYDPAGSWYIYGQPKPSPGKHSGYWADDRVWEEVAEIAAN